MSRKIRNVGYRAKVTPIAKVKMIAQSNKDDLNRFLNAKSIKNAQIDIEDIEAEYSDAAGDYDDFYELVREGTMDDPLDRIIEYQGTDTGFEEWIFRDDRVWFLCGEW